MEKVSAFEVQSDLKDKDASKAFILLTFSTAKHIYNYIHTPLTECDDDAGYTVDTVFFKEANLLCEQ